MAGGTYSLARLFELTCHAPTADMSKQHIEPHFSQTCCMSTGSTVLLLHGSVCQANPDNWNNQSS